MEPIKSNLEPIEESDMNLEGKLRGMAPEKSAGKEMPLADVEKETPREVSAGEKDNAYGKILSKVKQQTDDVAAASEVAGDAEVAAQKTDAETQISHLVDIAQKKGVVYAVKVARHMEDNFILDSFHDRLLADEFHDALLKNGMIKEI